MLSVDTTHPAFWHAIIAVFGAVVHALESHRNGRSKTVVDFIALTTMSSFSGVMFMLMGLQFLPDQPYLIAALAGTGGYLGVEGMSFIIEFLRKRFKL